MSVSDHQENISFKRTRNAFMWTRVLNTPFWALFCMLPYILYKDLHATPLQITVLIVVKPLTSIFSTYWSLLINKRRDRLRSNVIWAVLLGYFPFFFFPFVNNPWFFVFSSAVYMTFAQRGVIPAWMEILKLNIPGISRSRIFAYVSSLAYIGDAIWAFALGILLDQYFQVWRFLFPITALISLGAIFFQAQIPIPLDQSDERKEKKCTTSLYMFFDQMIKPWKNAWEVINRRSDFARFQIGFWLGGGGIMIMQPALPGFFMDILNLSYTELSVALTFCKGIGFALTSPFWAQMMQKVNIYRFWSWVSIIACLFPICLMSAQAHLGWLYFAYLCYGMMQAGSELCWNMSGPIFAKEEDSSVYSSVNVMMVGIRGAIVPVLGSLLCLETNSRTVIILGGFLFLFAALRMSTYSKLAQEEVKLAS